MNVVQAIAKLGLQPLNIILTRALLENTELQSKWKAMTNGKGSVLTLRTKHIEPYMFYFGVENGHYVVNTKHGPAFSAYSKEQYLEWVENHRYLSVVDLNHKVVYGAFHKEEIDPRLLFKIARVVNKERDSQRQKLYNWQHWYDQQMPALSIKLNAKQVKKLVHTVLYDYGFDLNRIVIADEWNTRVKKAIARHSHVFESKLDSSTFMLLIYEFNNTDLGTVLHEIAHSIVLMEYSSWHGPVAGHGPEYCLILAELFHVYAGIPIELTYSSMRKAKLKVAPIEDFFDGKKYQFYRKL